MVIEFLLLLASSGQVPDIDQVRNVVASQNAGLHDFEFLSEGRIEFVDTSDPEFKEKAAASGKTFQSSYAKDRSTGAAHLDLYILGQAQNSVLVHDTIAVNGDKARRIAAAADYGGRLLPQESPGGPDALAAVVGSPERFLISWFWDRIERDPRYRSHAEVKGWESIGDERCLLIEVAPFGKGGPDSELDRAWVDLEHGGHLRKFEMLHGGVLWYRIDDISLDQFSLPEGGKVWFPTRGRYQTFINGSPTQTRNDPVLREINGLNQGTLVLNRRLGTKRFSLEWRGDPIQGTAFDRARRDFSRTPKKVEPIVRRDEAGINEDLQRRLEEAERQSRALDASQSAVGFWRPDLIAQFGLAAFGLAVLLAAFVLRRRGW